MTDTNKSGDLLGVFKDIRATGTQELGKNVGSMLSSTPPNTSPSSWTKPTGNGNQISISQEKREKDIIERRKS